MLGTKKHKRTFVMSESAGQSVPANGLCAAYIIVDRRPFYHATRDSVDREKMRLKEKHPGRNFKVLKTVSIGGEITPQKLREVADLLEQQLAEREQGVDQ